MEKSLKTRLGPDTMAAAKQKYNLVLDSKRLLKDLCLKERSQSGSSVTSLLIEKKFGDSGYYNTLEVLCGSWGIARKEKVVREVKGVVAIL